MVVKLGYKQTDVGVIPEEWDAKYLREVVDFANGRPHEGDLTRGGRYFLITLDSIGIEGSLKAQHKETDVWDDSLKKDDLVAVLSDLAYGNLLGLCDLIPKDGKYVLNQRMGRLRLKVAADPLFIRLQINRRQSHFKKRGQGTSQRHIYKRDFDALEIPFAPEPEQRAIATALSDVDGLLHGLDRLIAKKRDFNQAAMQQLLTGQTRLPGFHGEWEVKRLGNIFTISAGKSKSSYVVEDGDYWVCDMGSVSTKGRLIVSKRTNYCGDFLKKGDLIMPKDDIGGGNIIGKVGYINANHTYILGDHVYCLRALEGNPRFLAFVINSHRVNSELRKKVIGSAQLGLGRKSVNEQEIQFPKTPEQTAIAEVLTEMDAELEALEQRREKTRALKQAMMQELLTGRTRLV